MHSCGKAKSSVHNKPEPSESIYASSDSMTLLGIIHAYSALVVFIEIIQLWDHIHMHI